MAAKYIFSIPALLLLFVGVTAAQTGQSTAPVKWERYSIPDRKISLLLPKLPNVEIADDPCSELERRFYFAYAEHSIYELVVSAKGKMKIPEWCQQKTRFGEDTLARRLSELRDEREKNSESQNIKDGRPLFHFENSGSERWVMSDMTNGRWVELAVHGRESRKANAEGFRESLELDSSGGINIGDGSKTTLGDAVLAAVVTKAEKKAASEPEEQKPAAAVDNIRVISKPRARYTDDARRANAMGSVRLKVTLLADGSVGAVTPVKELPNGLTEQAISAAKRLVFLPKRFNGEPVSVVQIVDYSFSIY